MDRGSGDGTYSGGVSAQTYSLGSTISGLNSSGLVLMVNAAQRSDTDLFHIFNRRSIAGYMQVLDAAPVTVSAGKTAQMLVRSLPSGASYSVTIQSAAHGRDVQRRGRRPASSNRRMWPMWW